MMKKMVVRTLAAVVLAVMLAAPASPRAAYAATGPLCYVDIDATGGTNNGNSWANAYTSLQSALTDTNCTEIWVAEGLYKPTTDSDRMVSFIIPADVEVYGGFAATEAVRTARNPAAHVTILSGDVDGNDDNSDGNYIAETYLDVNGNNSYHVVVIDGSVTTVTAATVLDGFTITAGEADGAYPQAIGGGLYCNGNGIAHECSPTLNDLVISGNLASFSGGGGAYMRAVSGGMANAAFTNVTFQGNYSDGWGGAIYNAAYSAGSNASPSFTNVTFTNNSSGNHGGAMENDGRGGTSSPFLTNVTFYSNTAYTSGGAMFNDGSMGGHSSPILRNVTFNGNSASSIGGAICSEGSGGTSTPSLTNVILWGDLVNLGGTGPEIYNSSATPAIHHSIVEGSGGSGAGWDTSLGTDGGNNLDADPMLGPLTDNGGITDTMTLIWGSPAIDTGDNATCAAAPVNGVDQRGVPRPMGPRCDIGAVERVPPGIRADFDSDGISDIGYFRAASGLWAILESTEGFSYARPRYHSWGQTGDIIAPGDYDGDGRIDPTIRRPPAGGQSAAYIVLLSTMDYDFGSSLTIPAGWPGLNDTPVPGEYNGDGRSDPAIWRGNTGVWIIPLSPDFTTYAFYSWGQSGDTPIGADVDGDGRTDIGYWRPSTGVWGFLLSLQGYSYASPLFFSWGTTGDIPVMVDYDGDHKADPAVVIPPAGGQSRAYRILLSTEDYDPTASVTIPAGWPGLNDTPVPGDYDGDGKADAGIWRANTGVWIIPMSSTNNTSYIFAAWGASGDMPAR